ncbi:MAG: T9SS type A sorting domain-containing protein [Saprospiraceae bacterium]
MKKEILYIGILIFFLNICVAQVIIATGTQMVCNGNINVLLENLSFVNNGTFNAGAGTVYFNGNTDQIVSNAATPFNNISINKPIGTRITLMKNIDVSGNIVFTSGLLDLNKFNINLSTSSILVGETDNARITGTTGGFIQISSILNSPQSSNPGNLGAIITSSQNLGNTIIKRGHTIQTDAASANFSIQRYYDITPVNNTGLNATLRLNYFDAELNNKSENNLYLWKSTDTIHWTSANVSNRNITSNFIEANNIASFSRWTISDKALATGIFDLYNSKNSLQVWPNPFTEEITISLASKKADQSLLQLVDTEGKILYSRQMSILAGNNIFNLNASAYSNGVYYLNFIASDGSTLVSTIIKQE